jgi:PAS domain S-box-containing protein
MPRPLKILIAEDNPVDAELLVRQLRHDGFAPEWDRVDTEAAYVARLPAGFDLVISDFDMPQFNGFRALELLKERGLDIPFVLVSGTIGEDVAVRAMKAGASDYLMKDRLTRLGQAVNHALDEARLRRERRQAEDGLRSAHAQLGQLLEQSPAVLYVLKLVGDKVVPHLVSENITLLLGFTAAEASAYEWWLGQLHPDDRERALNSVAQTIGDGTSLTEYRLRHKDGHYCWVDDARRLVRDAAGVPIELIGAWTDITERKRAEEVVRQASGAVVWNRRKRAGVELVILVVAAVPVYGLAHRFEWFEAGTRWILAHDAIQLDEVTLTVLFFSIGLGVFAFRRWRETESELTGRQQVQAAMGLLHDELDRRVKQRTGELSKANEALRTEIAERRRTAEALRDSELRFGTAFRSSPAAIAINRRRDLINLEVNDAFLRLFECTREQIVGHTLLELRLLENETVMSLRDQLNATGAVNDLEVAARTSRGTPLHVNLCIRVIQLGGEECTLLTAVDITERKKSGKKIRDQLDELLRWQEVMLNREDRVLGLKQEINDLLAQQNLPLRYNTDAYHEISRAPG